MLVTIGIILLVLWFFGFTLFHIAGGLIHLLLLIAVVLFLIRVIQGKNPLK